MCRRARSILSGVFLLVWPALGQADQSGVDPGVPDTLIVDSVAAFTGSSAIVPVVFVNDEPLGGIEVTLEHSSPDVYVDSVSFVGGRVASLTSIGFTTSGNVVTIYVIAFADLIPSGSGLLATIHYGYPSSITPQLVGIDSTTVISGEVEYSTLFSDEFSSTFTPRFVPGQIEIMASGCCVGDRGNINGSAEDGVDISDLVFLVDYMFRGGPAPVCLEEADLNASGGNADISDLVYLVNYMFTAGPTPPPCL